MCARSPAPVCVCVFCDVLNLPCCRVFQADLEARLQRWGADCCVGDVFVKLCSRLRVYSNYFNNYTTALRSIDKVPQLRISQVSRASA